MNLKYAVVSSDSNSEYLDFWPYVAKAWKNLIDLDPVLLFIDNHPPPEWTKSYGEVFFLQSIPDWSIVQQSQSIRFWAAKLLNAPFIISDMDMLPISREYYHNGAKDIPVENIVSYSSDIIKYRWYKTNPQYPMCYLAGDPKAFLDLLEIKENTHQEFLRRLKNLNIRYGTDQKFFYNQSQKKPQVLKHLSRVWIQEKYASHRLDKAIWPNFDYNPLEYIDCHLPRPLSGNKRICDILFGKLGIQL